jgi:O-antigen ligase
MLIDEKMESSAGGVGKLTLLVAVIGLAYTLFNGNRTGATKGLLIRALWYGLVSMGISVAMAETGSVMSYLSIITNIFYWIAVLSIAYFATKRDGEIIEIIPVWAVISLSAVAFVFFKKAVIYNTYDNSQILGLNDAYFLLLNLPLVLLLRQKMLRNAAILVIMAGLLLSFKRGGVIAFVVAMAAYSFAYAKIGQRRVGRALMILVAFSIIFFFAFNFVSQRVGGYWTERFSTITEDQGSGRFEIWREVLDLQLTSDIPGWIFGHGYSAVSRSTSNERSAHNDFQEVLFDYGIIGFTLYLMVIASLIKVGKTLCRARSRYFPPFAASFAIFLVLSVASHLVIYPSYFVYLSIFWGLTVAVADREALMVRKMTGGRELPCAG